MSTFLRAALTLLAGFFIGIHLAVGVHEVGHALGSLVSGVKVHAIVMFTPFPAGYVLPASEAFWHVWGGVAFGTVMAVVPLAASRGLTRYPALRLCARFTAACCLGHNAIYLVAGSILPFGDALNMMHLGAPRWLLLVLGLPLLSGFVVVLASCVEMLELPPAAPAWKWIVAAEFGLLPLPALMVWMIFASPKETAMRQPMLVLLGLYAVCFFAATYRAREGGGLRMAERGRRISWRWTSTLAMFAGAVLVVGLEWLVFSHPA